MPSMAGCRMTLFVWLCRSCCAVHIRGVGCWYPGGSRSKLSPPTTGVRVA